VPGGLHLTLPGVDSKGLVAAVPEVAFSDGSACETDRDPDYVLKALGRPDAAHHSIRLQVGRLNTPAQMETAADLLAAGIDHMRRFPL
jgi:cysteine desulfurase